MVAVAQVVLDKTVQAMNEQIMKLPRAIIAKKAIDHSRFILTPDLETAALVSNAYAPEHLIIQTNDDQQLLPKLTNASSIFVGPWTPESAGDYASGTNHVLPTYGYSRTHSSLSLLDFYRRYTVQTISSEGMRNIGPAIVTLATAEGLTAHANAAKVRLSALEKQTKQVAEFKQVPVGSK